MKHDARCYQQIVLVIVRGVRESRQIIIQLNYSEREARIQRDIDAPANSARKLIRSVAYPGDSAAGMRGTQQQLCEGLWLVFPFEPRLGKPVTYAGQIRDQRQ